MSNECVEEKFAYGVVRRNGLRDDHNARELECARYHCAQLGIELVEIDLEFIARYFHSSLLEGPDAVPEGDYDFDNMKSTVVPFRNVR